jgi:hypothetical protein
VENVLAGVPYSAALIGWGSEVQGFFTEHLGADPGHGLTTATWLTVPTQVLRELTGGVVFHDGLGLLMHRVCPPYSKWLGTAFAALPCAPGLTPHLAGALSARSWEERERSRSDAGRL